MPCKALMHERFRRLAHRSSEIVGSAEMFLAGCVGSSRRPCSVPQRLFRDVAASHQHGNDNRQVSHGFHHPERTEPRRPSDELIARKGAKTGKVRLEEMTDQDLCALAGDFEKLRSRLAAALQEPHVSSMTKRPAANVMPEGSESKE